VWTRRRLADGLGFAELHGGGSRVVLIPALGGRIRDLTIGGRQWLWHNPEIPFALPASDARSYVLEADSGGWDECVPTIAPCTLGDRELRDHGDLWAQRAEVAIETTVEGQRATCEWSGRTLPFRARRTVTVTPSGAIRFDYALTNTGTARAAFQWATHPLFPLTAETRIELPEGAELRIDAHHGMPRVVPKGAPKGTAPLPPIEARVWPHVTIGGVPRDLSRPFVGLEAGQACMLFAALPRRRCTVAVEQEGARLEFTIDGAQIPWVGLWLNRGGWSPFPPRASLWEKLTTRRRPSYCNLAIEPCFAPAGSLADAVAGDGAITLGAGETYAWDMTLNGST
jgi:galactose mutarotase-like enzyme